MKEELKLTYTFDFVHDGQRIFRQLLHAMANPGQITSIQEESDKFHDVYAPLTAIGCTLLDHEESIYVEKNPRLFEELHNLTLCRSGQLTEADYVFLSSEMNYGAIEQILKNVKKGTFQDPQDSATMILLCQNLTGTEEMTIEGPGIDGTRTIQVNPYIKKICAQTKFESRVPFGN